uniref:Endonuclease/exonuclease/phosphatase domain-containing protein n=1 Tax=Meloidogyne incognita TaxID=6306 RepID=A0A914LMW2_MELIC
MPTSVKSSTSTLQSSPIISTSVNFSASQGTIANTSIFSDIDLREETGIIKLNKKILSRQSKQKTVAQIKEQLCHSCVTNIENASVERVQSDLDLRQKLPQVSLPSTSKNSERRLSYTREEILNIRPPKQQKQENSVEELSLDHKTFASRIRYEHLSSQIDLSKNYKLVGLRYYQQILGKEIVPTTNKFLRIPLSVVSFNVLCQHYANTMSHLYQHLRGAKSAHKLWNSRKQKLELEFDRIDADIFCLQEVQDVHYEEFYLPYFTSRGFQGLFTRKTGGLQTPDGCAIFWRQSKITLLYINQVSFNLFIPPTMNSPNIGQVAIFGLNDCLYNSSAFCISNTHIFFQMKKGAIKLAQIAYLLGHMKKAETEFVASMKMQKDPIRKYNFVGHILCGDFNIEPTSPLHHFLMEQKAELRSIFSSTMALRPASNTIPLTCPSGTSIPLALMKLTKNCELVDSKDIVDPQLFIVRLNTVDFLSHDFLFASVYEHFNAVGEPEISSYHMEESTPDFILYTVSKNTQQFGTSQNASTSDDSSAQQQKQLAIEGFIQLRKRLSLPTLNELEKACGKLPNEQYGSDHLLLCAEFDILCPIIKP